MNKSVVHENPWFTIVRETQDEREYFRLQAPDSAIMIASTRDGRILLIRGTRHTSAQQNYELPGGIVESAELPIAAAMRETKEETGYLPSAVTGIGQFMQAPAISSTLCHVFTGTVGDQVAANLEDGEDWIAELVEVEELLKLMLSRRISDGATLAALALYLSHRGQG